MCRALIRSSHGVFYSFFMGMAHERDLGCFIEAGSNV